jgi:hypothetical protein
LEYSHLALGGVDGAQRQVEVAVLHGKLDQNFLEPLQVVQRLAREAN